jgi:ribonuclease HI
MSKIQLYTDGASNVHSPKLPGGWAYVYVQNNMMLCSGWDGEAPTTNQRMELMGAIMGLERRIQHNELGCIQYDEIEIITDSAYLYRCMTELWYIDWQFNNWRKLDNSEWVEIKNADLWQRLIALVKATEQLGIRITWTKIRGHKGVLYNEVCDSLARKGKVKVS